MAESLRMQKKNTKIKTLISLIIQPVAASNLSLSKKFMKTSKFINGKMLMFVKVFCSRLYINMIDTFAFPNNFARDVYFQNKMIKCIPYLILSNTESGVFMLIFIFELDCSITEEDSRKLNLAQIWNKGGI